MAHIDYDERIPNNVDLSSDRRLKKALEKWQPAYLDWWKSVGPQVFSNNEIYLRTAISTKPGGWANFGHVRMPEYRWGVFLADKEEGRVIPGGDHAGKPVWDEVPGEYRNTLKRLIVVQADPSPPRWSSSAGSPRPRPPLRRPEPLPGQRRGGPSPLGHGLPARGLLRLGRPG